MKTSPCEILHEIGDMQALFMSGWEGCVYAHPRYLLRHLVCEPSSALDARHRRTNSQLSPIFLRTSRLTIRMFRSV
ncbi:hypothetical protein BD310DRAFT_938902 [Dichomitus squalens]|uniref:Uncharacterized protein n=1 Tax=Dichomitus squalens TaxID=114155 RepID=A0A4Q9PDW2_9APHY|nr:hypothetical protein BD310DRAFT_938902 [Dichomitus squalens]